jgi:hypothetical protein
MAEAVQVGEALAELAVEADGSVAQAEKGGPPVSLSWMMWTRRLAGSRRRVSSPSASIAFR